MLSVALNEHETQRQVEQQDTCPKRLKTYAVLYWWRWVNLELREFAAPVPAHGLRPSSSRKTSSSEIGAALSSVHQRRIHIIYKNVIDSI